MMTRLLGAVSALLTLLGAPAEALVVRLCNTDTEGYSGAANFQTAIAAGGTITFECPAGSVIRFTRAYTVIRTTKIQGSNNVTLDGDGHAMFSVQFGGSLSFSDINIRHGDKLPGWPAGGIVTGDGQVELVRTNVAQSRDALWLNSGALRIHKSNFSDKRGILLHAPHLEIEGSRFQSNGGTPIFADSGSVSIANSEFVSNGTSSFADCALTINNSTFNAHTGIGNGGGLRINCNAVIERSQFHNNRADHGGAIYIGGEATEVSLRRVRFGGNSAQVPGGAIAGERYGELKLIVRSGFFESNQAWQGGAINLGLFYGNTRLLQGAGITFKGNSAVQKGGAIYAINADVRLGRTGFVENEAAEGGGAVYIAQEGTKLAEFANSLFVKNRSKQGGRAFHGDAASFVNCTIAANEGTAIWPEAVPPSSFGLPTVFPI